MQKKPFPHSNLDKGKFYFITNFFAPNVILVRAKLIKNIVSQNKQTSPEELTKMLEDLSHEVELYKAYDALLEQELVRVKVRVFLLLFR